MKTRQKDTIRNRRQPAKAITTFSSTVSSNCMGNARLCMFIATAVCGASLISCKSDLRDAKYSQSAPDPCSAKNEFFPPDNASWAGSGLHFGADQAAWEAKLLTRMHEPSLYACSATKNLQYRFLWDRSFHPPIALRLEVVPDGTGFLYVHILANAGLPPSPKPDNKTVNENEWFRLSTDQQVTVSREQVQRAQSLFKEISFWPPHSYRSEMEDGSDWIFESKIQNQYRLVDFRNNLSPAAKAFGLYLAFDLAKLKIPPNAIY